MAATTRPGRPREFDRDDVLDAAVDVFWRQGFTGTSMRDLETTLGISQSSIYNSFGSKRELLEAALDRYEKRVHRELIAPLERTGGVDAAVDFLDSLQRWITADGRSGCLIINLMAGESDDAEMARRTKSFRDGLRMALTEAFREEPGMTSEDATAHAELILTTALGLNVAARGGAPDTELATMVSAAKAHVVGWHGR